MAWELRFGRSQGLGQLLHLCPLPLSYPVRASAPFSLHRPQSAGSFSPTRSRDLAGPVSKGNPASLSCPTSKFQAAQPSLWTDYRSWVSTPRFINRGHGGIDSGRVNMATVSPGGGGHFLKKEDRVQTLLPGTFTKLLSIWCSLASAERPMLPGASCLEQLHIIPLECLGMLSISDFVLGIGDQKSNGVDQVLEETALPRVSKWHYIPSWVVGAGKAHPSAREMQFLP